MKLTKYEHACLVLEEQGKKLVIDPGVYSNSLPDLQGVVAVVVTHVHGDHCNAPRLQKIVASNPGVKIFSTSEVAKEVADLAITVAAPGAAQIVGPFTLAFFGELHALVHPDFPRNQNVSVLVNNSFYYPGDSFNLPEVPVSMLALPVSAPWLKFVETVNFLDAIKPKACFPTHNVFLSKEGSELTENMLSATCAKHGISYTHLEPGQSLDF